jgi:hypothetical protein
MKRQRCYTFESIHWSKNDMHYAAYRYGMQVLQEAVQQMMLVPLEEMEEFLVAAMEASGEETDLEKRKMKAAEDQLELIRLALPFAVGVRSLLGSN